MKRVFGDNDDDLLRMSGVLLSGLNSKITREEAWRGDEGSFGEGIGADDVDSDVEEETGCAEKSADGKEELTGRMDSDWDFFRKSKRNPNFGVYQPDNDFLFRTKTRSSGYAFKSTVPPMSERMPTNTEENFVVLSDLTVQNESLGGTLRLMVIDRHEMKFKSVNAIRKGFLRSAPSIIYVLLADGSRNKNGNLVYVTCQIMNWHVYELYHVREAGLVVDFVGFSYSADNRTLTLVESSYLKPVDIDDAERFEKKLGDVAELPDLVKLINTQGDKDIREVMLAECVNDGVPCASNISVTFVVVKIFETEFIGGFKKTENGKDYRTMMVVKDGNDELDDACLFVCWTNENEPLSFVENGAYKISQCYQKVPPDKRGPKFELHMGNDGQAWALPRKQLSGVTDFSYDRAILREQNVRVRFCSFARANFYGMCPKDGCSRKKLYIDTDNSTAVVTPVTCEGCKTVYNANKPELLLRVVLRFRYQVKVDEGSDWSAERTGAWFQSELAAGFVALGKELPFKWPNYFAVDYVSTLGGQINNFIKKYFVKMECDGVVSHRSNSKDCLVGIKKVLTYKGKVFQRTGEDVFVRFPTGNNKLLATVELKNMIKAWNLAHAGHVVDTNVTDVEYPRIARATPKNRFQTRH